MDRFDALSGPIEGLENRLTAKSQRTPDSEKTLSEQIRVGATALLGIAAVGVAIAGIAAVTTSSLFRPLVIGTVSGFAIQTLTIKLASSLPPLSSKCKTVFLYTLFVGACIAGKVLLLAGGTTALVAAVGAVIGKSKITRASLTKYKITAIDDLKFFKQHPFMAPVALGERVIEIADSVKSHAKPWIIKVSKSTAVKTCQVKLADAKRTVRSLWNRGNRYIRSIRT